MSTKVFRYGARHQTIGDDLKAQLRLGHDYYNTLVAAENERRRALWGGEHPPKPAEGEDEKKHYRALRAAYRDEPLLDLKPLRSVAVAGGLYWGTYLKAEAAFAAAWKSTDIMQPVSFRSWRQGGIVAVQIQKGVPPERLVRIERAPDPRTGRRAGQRHTVSLRTGRNSWSTPIEIEMHRPLQGTITWVVLHLKYVNRREVWSVQFTCKGVPERADNAARGVVAIDVGWRKLDPGRVRMAFARGDDGRVFEFSMPPAWAALTARADDIRSIRDKRLFELQAEDPRVAKVQKPPGVERLGLDDLRPWVLREGHLWRYETGLRRRSVAARRDAMRVWLRMLRRQYAKAVIKDSAHKEMKEDKKLPPAARRRGHHAAPGEIIEEIGRVFGRDTVAVVKAPYTNACKCGAIGEQVPDLLLECAVCGEIEDRDLRSTRNMMARWAEGEAGSMSARKTTARFAKRHAASASSVAS